jgi:predicted transposase YdaD
MRWENVEAILILSDLKNTRFDQEVTEEGLIEGERESS